MKNDDLERLETSEEIQRLIRSSRKQYEQDKMEHAPAPFSTVREAIRQQRNPIRRGISSWWLVAACFLGCVIGYTFSGKTAPAASSKLAVADTVVVYRQHTDTVYREIILSPKAPVAAAKPMRKPIPALGTSLRTELDFLSPEFLQQRQSLPDPESEYYATGGMTVEEGNYPLHLLVSAR